MAEPQEIRLPVQDEKTQVIGFLFASCEAKTKAIADLQGRLQITSQQLAAALESNRQLTVQIAEMQKPPQPAPPEPVGSISDKALSQLVEKPPVPAAGTEGSLLQKDSSGSPA